MNQVSVQDKMRYPDPTAAPAVKSNSFLFHMRSQYPFTVLLSWSMKKPDILLAKISRDEDPEFFSTDPDPDPAQLRKKNPDPTPDPT